ncbi:MAG: type II secretion system protein [Gemmatimonadota bacterium]
MSRVRQPRRADSRRAGFSLIELLMAVSIVGIIAGLAIPNLTSMTYRARATSVVADLQAVRVATVNYNGDQHAWPASAGLGTVPTELNGFLPEGFSFAGDGYTLQYSNQAYPGGLPGDPNTTQLIFVSVTADRDELSNAIVELLGSALVFSAGNTHSVVIDRS